MTKSKLETWVLAEARKQIKTGVLSADVVLPKGISCKIGTTLKCLLGTNLVVRFARTKTWCHIFTEPRYGITFDNGDGYASVGFPTLASAHWALKYNSFDSAELKDDFTDKILSQRSNHA